MLSRKGYVMSCSCIMALLVVVTARAEPHQKLKPLDYRIELDTVLRHDDGKFLWYHPRATPLPGFAPDGSVAVLMTLLRHLSASDFYSGTYVMRTDDMGHTWSEPTEPRQLAWRHDRNGVIVSVCDVTPGWHAPSGKVLVIGGQLRYSQQGQMVEDQRRSQQTAYAVFDPKTRAWSPWQILEMPPDEKFDFARSASAQWLVLNGTLLLPIYFGKNLAEPSSVTTVQCSFDGEKLKYLRHGDEFGPRDTSGLYEPSLASYRGRFYMTVRHDLRGYVAVSNDGLHFEPLKSWLFDDGAELGSYNTQQHWLVHSDGLFLVYTRRGANNDHIPRHRAPLFMAQVDPSTLRVVRSTERIVVPERGGELGNFGASAIDQHQSWVTVSEGVWDDDARRRGAEGATFVARITWSKPNSVIASPEERR